MLEKNMKDKNSQENNHKISDLLLSEERLKMVLEGSEQGFWDWNIETNEVKRNDRWCQMLGYSTITEFNNNTDTWSDAVHPDDRDAAWKSINDHLEGHTSSHEMEYRMLTKDGGFKWILDRAKVVQRDSNGLPLRMSGTHTDISVRVQLEEERENLIKSLKDALSEIKTLKGIIPMCSYCHNIRDAEGAWDRMEAYLAKYSDAEISHGICPKCYPKVLANSKINKKT
jgi:PAS domain S-box-containing protein